MEKNGASNWAELNEWENCVFKPEFPSFNKCFDYTQMKCSFYTIKSGVCVDFYFISFSGFFFYLWQFKLDDSNTRTQIAYAFILKYANREILCERCYSAFFFSSTDSFPHPIPLELVLCKNVEWLLFHRIRGIFGFTANAWWIQCVILFSHFDVTKCSHDLAHVYFGFVYILFFFFFFFALPYLWIYGNTSNNLRRWVRLVYDDIDVLHFACIHVYISDSCFSFVSSWFSLFFFCFIVMMAQVKWARLPFTLSLFVSVLHRTSLKCEQEKVFYCSLHTWCSYLFTIRSAIRHFFHWICAISVCACCFFD